MNITYIFGNGFDIEFGLETRYSDFYQYYRNVESMDEDIIRLKESIKSTPQNWADFEIGIGEYISNISDRDVLIKIHRDIVKSLSSYLNGLDVDSVCKQRNSEAIHMSMCRPYAMFFRDIQTIESAVANMPEPNRVHVNILTLNYTNVFERLFGWLHISPTPIVRQYIDRTLCLDNIIHMHGTIQNGLAFGLNDISQTNNLLVENDKLLSDVFLKPNMCRCIQTSWDTLAIEKIEASNVICIYGVSFGETDRRWWSIIGEQLLAQDSLILLIFHYYDDGDYSLNEGVYRIHREERTKDLFLDRISLSDSDKTSVRERIFVSVNSGIFNLHTKTNLLNSTCKCNRGVG